MRTSLCLIHQRIGSRQALPTVEEPKISQRTASEHSSPKVSQEEIAEMIVFFRLLDSWELQGEKS
jgi:hypothetical protein